MAKQNSKPEETVETPVVEETAETPVVEETAETPVVEETAETPVVEEAPKKSKKKKSEKTEEMSQFDKDMANTLGVNQDSSPREEEDDSTDDDGAPADDVADAESEEEVEDGAQESAVPGVTNAQAKTFADEVAENGELSEESYKLLEEAGYNKNVVDAYLLGQQAEGAQQQENLLGALGGKELYESKILPWAQANLTPENIAEYDEIMAVGGYPKAEAAAKALYKAYVEDQGSPAETQVTGTSANVPTGPKPYANAYALRKDLAKPEYRTSHAFRQEVAERAAASAARGISLS
jgi:hypothetical protein